MTPTQRPEPLRYPVSLDLIGRPVLLVGGGAVAARKLEGLLQAGAVVHVVAPELVEEIETAVGDAVRLSRRTYRTADLDGVWYAVEATGDPLVAARMRDDAEAARIFLNAADQPEACSAILPAVHRQGRLTVTYSTDGTSPAFASWLRIAAPTVYGPEIAVLLDLLADARVEMHAAGIERSGADWRQLLDSGILEEVRSGRVERAKERLEAWQSSPSE